MNFFTHQLSRRSFLRLGWGSLVAFLGTNVAAALRFFLPNVLYEPPQTFKIGRLEDYPTPGVYERWKKEQRIWIVRTDRELFVLWARCTHLGCTPNWFQAEGRIRCPCHGSNFQPTGDVIAGPAPKPLYRTAITELASGELLVDKSLLEDRPGLRDKAPFLIRLATV